MDQAALERLWYRRASSLARRLNLGWWLERFNSLLLGGLLLFAILLLLGRTWRGEWVSPVLVGGSLAALLLLLAAGAWWIGRSRFVDREAGLVRLDDRLSLNNRLATAASRVGLWPEYNARERGPADLRWNAVRAWIPGLAALILVAAAWWIPIPKLANAPAKVVEPSAWEQMEDWLATLEEEELIDEDTIEELEGQIEELRDQPEEEWFSHSSLEATDTLQQALGMEIRDLATEMNSLERDLSALQKFSAQMSESAKDQLKKQIQDALDALEGSGLPLDEALRKQLQGIDPSQLGEETLGNLTAEQMKALQEQLRKGSGALGSMEGLPEMEEGMMMGEGMPGFEEGEGPGKGGISRGRGDAPLYFGDKEDQLGTANLERVTNDDFSKAAIGEVLGIGEAEREIDETASGPAAGGTVNSPGKGGEAVSRETLLPDEQAVLKRYFK